ncbi:MAG TPA: alpha-amylase family glycosyl hydrolase [Candidatus Eisenbacteria bacterium]|nr:alpha-amylase family glycosyl hydrolase [Candidatus Eisenbacteria bacterium]
MAETEPWWQRGIVYQIFPLSFMDSNGDGIGDLPGIIARLGYVASLGVDAIWLSPIYPSPMADFGYDVADYTDVDPRFGSLDDFDRLVSEAHGRGLRVILDLVPNHTSDQHPWFIDSRSSRDASKRDWYIWRDPAPGGGPPNNWVSYFGSGWTLDPETGQYYFHQFRAEQPELNYANPAVLEAMLGVMRFWLDRGVDGFRVDVIALLAKDQRFLDEPPNPGYSPDQHAYYAVHHVYTENQPAVHDYIRAMRRVLDEYHERVMIGELDPFEGYLGYYGEDLDEVHLPFNFNLFFVPWQAEAVRRTADAYDAALPAGAWPNWVVGNHDRQRVGSRAGIGQARVVQMLLLTLRGTPFCYYGDEIGMADTPVPVDRLRDTVGYDPSQATRFSRDPQRTPMQWDATRPNAGFSSPEAEPWLPLAPDSGTVNVAVQEADERSVLALFRRLTALRAAEPALNGGDYRSHHAGDRNVFAYERSDGGTRVLVVLNFTAADKLVDLGAVASDGLVLLSTELDRTGREDCATLSLRPNEGVILRIG